MTEVPELQRVRAAREAHAAGDAPAATGTPRQVLDASRVDVIALIEHGIPPREWVPGVDGLLPRAKRVHVTAERKTGKSLVFGVIAAVQIIAAGGTAVVLDRENGSDEFARRLQQVLEARDADSSFRELVRARLAYHAWPALSLGWGEDYPAALRPADLVIFDSSRSHLTPLGLKEDLSDDFAAFTTSLIDPLMQAGIATITLDNSGHIEKDRARGTSAKEDLCDIAFTMTTLSPFSSTLAGRVQLRATASRIGEITPGDTWHLELGDGHYGHWERIGNRPPEAREELRDAAVEVLVAAGETLGYERVGKAIRARPGNTLKFSAKDLRSGLDVWATDPATGVLRDPSGKGFTTHVGQPRHDPHVATQPTQLDMGAPDTANNAATTGDQPMSDSPDTTRHTCHVACSPPLRGDTHDTATQNGHTDTDLDRLERLAARHTEVAT